MRLSYLIVAVIVSLGFLSCGKDDDSTPEANTKANIIGSVNLYDEGTTQLDNSDMIITVEGPNPVISATTDVSGNFTLLDVPFGTYTIVYEKSGYGTFKRYELEHEDTGSSTVITHAPSLGKLSTTQVTNLDANVVGDNVIISVMTDPAGSNANTRYIRYFLSSEAAVSNENYTFYSPGLVSRINPYEIILSQEDLADAGFSTGQTVYVKSYGDSFWSNEYDDPQLTRKVFPNLNMTSANSVSFVIP